MLAHARTIALFAALGAVVSAHSARGDDVDDLFRTAARHYADAQWRAACDAFAKLLEDWPEHERANQTRFHYGEALVQLGRYDLARHQFDELLKRDPKHRYAKHALFRAGEAAYLAGDRAAARRQLEDFRGRYPDDELNAHVLMHLGRIELEDGKPAAAEPLFSAALKRYPDGPLVDRCHLGLAESREALERLDEARRGYQQLVEAHSPLGDYALLRLAALDNDRGDHPAALTRLDRLAKEYPQSALAHRASLGRGYALYKLGKHDEAEAMLAGLANHQRLAVDAHYWWGTSQAAREAWKDAATTFAAGASKQAGHRLNETLTYHAARALLHDGQHPQAIEVFDRLLRQWPESGWADECWLGKLQVSAAAADHAASVRLADQFVAKFPRSPLRAEVEAAKGHALAALGQHADAAEALERSLTGDRRANDADGDRTQSQAELAMLYARLGRFADAANIVNTFYEHESPPAATDETCYHVAELAYAGDDLETAGRLFSLLVGSGRSNRATSRGLLGQGWCRFKAGDWQEAADAFGQLRERFGESPAAAEATMMRARALEHLGDSTAALAMYRAVLQRERKSPQTAEAVYRAARLCDKLEDQTEAIVLYARLVDEHADFGELDAAIYRWAWLVRQTNPTAAGELFARLRREFPNSQYTPDATLQLAERALAENKYDESRELLHDITGEAVPAAVRQNAWYLLGRVEAGSGNWEQAEAALARSIDEAPEGELALAAAYLRAEASYRRGRFDESAQRLEALTARSEAGRQTWSAAARLRYAQALVQLKKWPQALETARAMATDFPDFEQQYEVDYVIGRCLAAKAEFVGARRSYSKVIESPTGAQTETAAMARWMIGETYFHQENYTAALAEYRRVDAEYRFAQWRAAALLQAGKCHEHLGQWSAAVETYHRVLKEFPKSDLASEAVRRADTAQRRVATRSSPPN